MKTFGSSLFAVAVMLATAPIAHAQQAEPELLPESVVEGEKVDDAYEIGTGIDAGTSTIQQGEIEARTPGSGDVNQLLKVLPTVQFDRNEGIADREAIQDLRPADLSISGGRIYDNLITIDGIDANSRLDITETNPQNYNELAGASAQTLWLDSELIGAITLRDSNISAEYGRFTGGALDIQTREARNEWGASATVSYTEDGLLDYLISDGTRAAYEQSGDPLPEAPEFRKWRFGATIDVPLGDRGGLLLAANRSRADVLYFRSEAYDFEPGYRSSVSDNFLVSGNYDVAPELRLSGQVTYSPYERESASANGIDNLITSKGGGLAGKIRLESTGELRWDITANFAHNDTGRTAPSDNYSLPSDSTNGAVCANSSCTIGGFGTLDQTQDTYGLKATVAKDVGPGELRAGVDYQRIEVLKERPETNRAYLQGLTDEDTVCLSGDSLTCVTGEYYLRRYLEYRAYTADVDLDSVGIWTEYNVSLGPVELRAGLRYDHESFLGNHDISPRLAASWTIAEGWALSAGANRYYGRSMLGYAIREHYPNLYRYQREATVVNGESRVADGDWYLAAETVLTGYANADLDTPYSDELTAALTAPLFGGTARIKGIYRRGRDEFARSERIDEVIDNGNGTTSTRRYYEITNDARSKYRGGSLEWVRSWGKHTVALNVNYSKSFSDNDDYFTSADDIVEMGETVLFEGAPIDLVELENMNQRLEYASPFIVSASWTALWFGDRLTTNLNGRYRDGFERIEDTGVNEVVDGVRYDVYDYVTYPDRVIFDLNAQVDLLRAALGTVTADVRVNNLFNTIPAKNSVQIAQPYQNGRSFWVGLKYRY